MNCGSRGIRSGPLPPGVYRRNGRRYGFLLEYDRGTENRRDYLRKLAAYYLSRLLGRRRLPV